MKNFLSFFILLIYLAHPIQLAGIFINFKSNQEFIAKVLCINKEKPDLKCNGKCHLKKEIKKATEKQKEQSPKNLRTEENTQISEDKTISIKKAFTAYSPTYKKYNNSIPQFCITRDIFHPPQSV